MGKVLNGYVPKEDNVMANMHMRKVLQSQLSENANCTAVEYHFTHLTTAKIEKTANAKHRGDVAPSRPFSGFVWNWAAALESLLIL